MQILADSLERPVTVMRQTEAAALGAAMLAASAVHEGMSLRRVAEGMRMESRAMPRTANRGVYREGFARFQELYGLTGSPPGGFGPSAP